MGFIKKKLYNKTIKPVCEWYNNMMSLETNENLHLHYRNIRLEFSKEEWKQFASNIKMAFIEWKKLGEPELNKENDNNNTIYLPKPFKIKESSDYYATRFQVEEQSNVPTIHIHYRELRLEFGIEEFKEFGKGIKKALEELNNDG